MNSQMKYRLRLILPLLFLLSFLLLGSIAFADGEKHVSLKDLDAIVAKHPDLQSFLKDKKAIDEYFEALKTYMGPDKMQRDKFNAILFQLQDLSQKSPLLSQRLWETSGTGTAFSIRSTAVSYGRSLGKDWNPEKLVSPRVKPLGPSLGTLERAKEVARLAELVEMNEKSLNLEGLGRKQRGQAQALHFEKIRASAEVRILSEHYAHAILTSEHTQDLLRSGDPDLILDTVRAIRDNPRAFLPPESRIPGSVLTEMKKLLPDIQVLLKDKIMFPEILRETRKGSVGSGKSKPVQYDFTPVPRRLHGIWKGIPIEECVGGGCAVNVTPRRWSTVALENSHLYFLEKNGRYSGFVEAIPGKVGEKTFASLGFGAPDLRKKIYSSGAEGVRTQTTLFRKFLDEANARLPKGWDGFVLSASKDIDNAGVSSTSHSSVAFNMGEKLPPTEPFKLNDPLVEKIAALTPEGPYSSPKGIMIIDALTPNGEENLRVLSQLPESLMTDPKAVSELLMRADSTAAENVLKAIKQDPEFVEKIRPGLEAFLSREASSFGQERAASLYFRGGVNMDNEKLVGSLLRGLGDKNAAKLIASLDQRHLSALRTIEPRIYSWPQSREKLAFETILKFDPELKDPLNRAWVNQLIVLAAHGGEKEVLKEMIVSPSVRSEVMSKYPHLVSSRTASELLEWVRLHPEELKHHFFEDFKKSNPGVREKKALSQFLSEVVLKEPEKLSDIIKAINEFSLDGPEAKPLKVTIKSLLFGKDEKAVIIVSEALRKNLTYARTNFLPEMLKIVSGSPERAGWKTITTGYLTLEVDGKNTELMKKLISMKDKWITGRILSGIKGPLSPEMWDILRTLSPAWDAPDFELEKAKMIQRLDPDFNIPENEKFMRNLIRTQLQLSAEETKIAALVNQGIDKPSSRLLGEEIVRMKKYNWFFDLGNTIWNARDIHEPIIRGASDIEFSKTLIRLIQKVPPGQYNPGINWVKRWEDQIRLHPSLWSEVVSDINRDHPSIGAIIEENLAKIPTLSPAVNCKRAALKALLKSP